ncbi:MAG: protein-(glutamine-N5) methyltransferase, release factor-specific [Rhodospirillaceae bacterium]|nr:MAG: protein-(glutamine-N5) methyltransferase, release factor-specific [Rhodospirillaceae bacterium]
MPLSVDAAFHDAFQRFQTASIDTARLDARLLLGAVLGGGAERVLAESGRDLSAVEASIFEGFVKRRAGLEPISQILGVREFWSLSFKVTSATLTPRPDTETLIEAALARVKEQPKRILDLGTGSGCIVLSLLSEWKTTRGLGVDISDDALNVALHNAQKLGFDDRAEFKIADWRDGNWQHGRFDVVVSNPPYIPEADMQDLDADVRVFEPRTALVGGADGLDAYREIIAQLPQMLTPKGLVLFEVGIGQADDVEALLLSAGFRGLEQYPDLSGIARVVAGLYF